MGIGRRGDAVTGRSSEVMRSSPTYGGRVEPFMRRAYRGEIQWLPVRRSASIGVRMVYRWPALGRRSVRSKAFRRMLDSAPSRADPL